MILTILTRGNRKELIGLWFCIFGFHTRASRRQLGSGRSNCLATGCASWHIQQQSSVPVLHPVLCGEPLPSSASLIAHEGFISTCFFGLSLTVCQEKEHREHKNFSSAVYVDAHCSIIYTEESWTLFGIIQEQKCSCKADKAGLFFDEQGLTGTVLQSLIAARASSKNTS